MTSQHDSLLNSIPAVLFQLDCHIRHICVNDQFCLEFSLARDEIIGRSYHDLRFDPTTAAKLEEVARLVLDDGHERSLTFEILTKNGPSMLMAQFKRGTWFPGRSILTGIMVRLNRENSDPDTATPLIHTRSPDVQRIETLGLLAAGIAHDFNNLLTAIRGFNSMALNAGTDSDKSRYYLQQVDLVVRQAAEMCQQILIYPGKSTEKRSLFDLSNIVGEMATFLQAAVGRSVVIHLNLDSPGTLLEGEPTLIRHVVMNLIKNASESTGPQGGFVILRTSRVDADESFLDSIGSECLTPGRYVCLSVIDNGCGMPEEVRMKIFEPFFTTKMAGRGLGLAAVQQIVKSHGGEIVVDSAPGRGSTFQVLLPIHSEATHESIASAARTSQDAISRRFALIADDEEEVRFLLKQILEQVGFQVMMARDGHEAIELFQRRPMDYSVVIVDLLMPEMGGREAINEILRIRPDTCVILMSGYDPGDAVNMAGDLQTLRYLCKPFRIRELLSLLPVPQQLDSQDILAE